jgi:hypothetical protein
MNSTSFSAIKILDQNIVVRADTQVVKNPDSKTADPDIVIPVKKDTIIKSNETVQPGNIFNKIEENTMQDTIKREIIKPAKNQLVTKQVEFFTVFSVQAAGSEAGDKIPVNATFPAGLIYRIQVAVFRNPVDRAYFKGITPVYGFRLAGNDYTTYYAGMFRKVVDARKALLTVKKKGFSDAFIVALSGGKAISLERAAALEKEWGKSPFIVTQSAAPAPADTLPPELCFRVEVMRVTKAPKEDLLEGIKKIAGTAGFDTELNGDKEIVYLIGKFITYDSALSYADLLVRNGYREAKVVARLGNKEVPLEMARELFEKVE